MLNKSDLIDFLKNFFNEQFLTPIIDVFNSLCFREIFHWRFFPRIPDTMAHSHFHITKNKGSWSKINLMHTRTKSIPHSSSNQKRSQFDSATIDCGTFPMVNILWLSKNWKDLLFDGNHFFHRCSLWNSFTAKVTSAISKGLWKDPKATGVDLSSRILVWWDELKCDCGPQTWGLNNLAWPQAALRLLQWHRLEWPGGITYTNHFMCPTLACILGMESSCTKPSSTNPSVVLAITHHVLRNVSCVLNASIT